MKYHWTFGDIFGELPQRQLRHGVSFLVNNIFTINISTEKRPERFSSDPSLKLFKFNSQRWNNAMSLFQTPERICLLCREGTMEFFVQHFTTFTTLSVIFTTNLLSGCTIPSPPGQPAPHQPFFSITPSLFSNTPPFSTPLLTHLPTHLHAKLWLKVETAMLTPHSCQCADNSCTGFLCPIQEQLAPSPFSVQHIHQSVLHVQNIFTRVLKTCAVVTQQLLDLQLSCIVLATTRLSFSSLMYKHVWHSWLPQFGRVRMCLVAALTALYTSQYKCSYSVSAWMSAVAQGMQYQPSKYTQKESWLNTDYEAFVTMQPNAKPCTTLNNVVKVKDFGEGKLSAALRACEGLANAECLAAVDGGMLLSTQAWQLFSESWAQFWLPCQQNVDWKISGTVVFVVGSSMFCVNVENELPVALHLLNFFFARTSRVLNKET